MNVESQRSCMGPIYFADQGIEVCQTCGGCICCDFKDVDHARAEYECFKDDGGVCHLVCHEGRSCQEVAAHNVFRLIESKFREGLVPSQPRYVDVEELPGEEWRGLWRVMVWGQAADDTADITADVDVEAKSEPEAIKLAYSVFLVRTREEWIAEMPVVVEL